MKITNSPPSQTPPSVSRNNSVYPHAPGNRVKRIDFIAGVRKGLRELDEGKGISHEQVREEFSEWLSS